MKGITDGELRWYGVGYYDGRSKGEAEHAPDSQHYRRFYDEGYEAGVSDYCAEAHPEEIE